MTLAVFLFDLDGTLADTIPVCIQAFQATVQHFNGRVPAEAEIQALFGPSEEGMLEQLIPGRLDETLPYYLAQYEHFHAQCRQPFPGVERLFSVLKARGLRSAIVTGKGPHSAQISARILGLGRWVELIEAGSPLGVNKAHSMRLVLARWGLSPEQAAYVGDAPSDMHAARQAGVLPLGAAWAAGSLLRGQAADGYRVFAALEPFIAWVEGDSFSSPSAARLPSTPCP